MKRKTVSEKELILWINSQFKNTESCNSASISGVYELIDPKENNGCNWSASTYRTGDSPQEICNAVFAKIISEAIGTFNVAWPRQK